MDIEIFITVIVALLLLIWGAKSQLLAQLIDWKSQPTVRFRAILQQAFAWRSMSATAARRPGAPRANHLPGFATGTSPAGADIFISYSQSDRDLILKLSTYLEAEGWTVWWDKGLAPGDIYRDEIMKQLAAARAVITVWTENSVKSDWVRAEAGRAKTDGKLIPTKTSNLPYDEIPLPFGEMYTENVGSLDLVRAAVVAQLAKPATEQSEDQFVAKILKFQLLTWGGIIGGAITLFTNLGGILTLTDWAKLLVQRWHELTTAFWVFVFGWMGIEIPRDLVPLLTFVAFTAMLVVGTNLSASETDRKSRYQASPRKTIILLIAGVLLFLGGLAASTFGYAILQTLIPEDKYGTAAIVIFLIVWISPLLLLIHFGKGQELLFFSWCLFGIIGGILIFSSFESVADALGTDKFLSIVALPLLQFICVLLTPLHSLLRRLFFLIIGVMILIGLSEVSKLNLRPYLDPKRISVSGSNIVLSPAVNRTTM
jgi:hypothetical protein